MLPTLQELIAKQTFTGRVGNDGTQMTVQKAQAFIEHFVRNTAYYVKRQNNRLPGEPDWYWTANDNVYSASIRGSKGCMHYANFVAAVMHWGVGNAKGES